jgi:hypothetical protein
VCRGGHKSNNNGHFAHRRRSLEARNRVVAPTPIGGAAPAGGGGLPKLRDGAANGRQRRADQAASGHVPSGMDHWCGATVLAISCPSAHSSWSAATR